MKSIPIFILWCVRICNAKNAFGLCTHKTQLLWVFTMMDLLSVQLSMVLQLEL
jgi:hypothetical protein